MAAKIERGDGFIAALDQSGGSTPKALKGYGIDEGAWSNEEEMFGLIHQMRRGSLLRPASRAARSSERSCSNGRWTVK